MDVINHLLACENNPPLLDPAEDIVFVKNVLIQAMPGPDAWDRDKAQTLSITVKVPHNTRSAGQDDRIASTLDYRTVYKTILQTDTDEDTGRDGQGPYTCLSHLAYALGRRLGRPAEIWIEAPKAILNSEGIVLRLVRGEGDSRSCIVAMKNMTIPCIIGIGAHERDTKQPVIVSFATQAREVMQAYFGFNLSIRDLSQRLIEKYAASSFLTLEAFVRSLAQDMMEWEGLRAVAISAHKPAVFGMAEGPGVLIYRTWRDFAIQESPAQGVA